MKSIKEHVGFVVGNVNAAAAMEEIVAAEEAGIRQIWKNQANLDTLTIFAAAAFFLRGQRRQVKIPGKPVYVKIF